MEVTKKEFGIIENKTISLYTLTNSNGMEMNVTNYGCIVTSIKVPDKNGQINDIVLGFNELKDYNVELSSPSIKSSWLVPFSIVR